MYKVGIPIVVVYQANNSATGLTIKMDVFDETYALDASKSVAAMTEMGTTGRYYASFTPDAEGEWVTMMYELGPPNKGQAVKAHRVGDHDIDSVGDAVGLIKAKTDNLPSDPANQTDVESAIAASESSIRGADADTLKTLSDQLDALDSPPMVG
jgi:hypothetical protein